MLAVERNAADAARYGAFTATSTARKTAPVPRRRQIEKTRLL
jgi:hypothetical protein